MTRRVLLAALAGPFALRPKAKATSIDSEIAREIDFTNAWSAYITAKLGCPAPTGEQHAAVDLDRDCRAPGRIRAEKYHQARELAKKIFSLDEKRGR